MSAGDRLVTKPSPFSVADTVARLSRLVTEKGITLFGVIDHSGEAHARASSCATPRSSSSAARTRAPR